MDEHMDEEHVGYPRGERSSWIWSGCSVMGALCAVHLTWICLFLIAFFLAGLLSFLGATASISIPIVIFVFSFFFCCFVIMNNDFMAHEQGEENDEGPTTIAKRISAVLGDMTEASAEKRESRRLSRSSSRNSRNSGSGEMIGAGSGMARTSTFSDQEGIVSRWQVEFAEEGDLSIGLIKSRVEESWCDFDEERQNLFLAAVLSNTNHVTYENDGHVYEVDLSVNRKSGVLQIPDMGISRRLRLVHVRPTTDQQTHSAPLITLPAAPSQALEPTSTKWQVSMGGGKWVDFDQAQQAQFHAAKANGQATVSFKLRHDNYEARFATLEQVNLKTGRSRAIREISNAGVASEDFDDAELAGDMDETKPDPIRVSSFQSRTL
eukprot:TRINITY_DN9730_c0_g1_i1.p1 TRINITY_DN9730_c0_g1~~TRINITY_DN9730_c0_g1_i1.p1  ORF type:complete len:378 (+),score=73.54 TRINITY_DN9730_c0_g1_i1:94-1227(+)